MKIPANYNIPDHNLQPPDDDFNYYDVEQPKICALCGELIDIGWDLQFANEIVCEFCFNSEDDTEEEKIQYIKKYKK